MQVGFTTIEEISGEMGPSALVGAGDMGKEPVLMMESSTRAPTIAPGKSVDSGDTDQVGEKDSGPSKRKEESTECFCGQKKGEWINEERVKDKDCALNQELGAIEDDPEETELKELIKSSKKSTGVKRAKNVGKVKLNLRKVRRTNRRSVHCEDSSIILLGMSSKTTWWSVVFIPARFGRVVGVGLAMNNTLVVFMRFGGTPCIRNWFMLWSV